MMQRLMENNLSAASGVTGFEEEINREIIKNVLNYSSIKKDRLGNLIFKLNGLESTEEYSHPRKVLLAAHMDEVGLIVTYIDDEGFVYFTELGGVPDNLLLNQLVYVGDNKIPGIIGCKPPHKMTAKEAETVIKKKDMFIDVGGKVDEIDIGDQICFNAINYTVDNLFFGKAVDNRAGCAVMIDVMNNLPDNINPDVYAAATVQEENGLKGSKTVAEIIKPDIAIILDVTIAGDHPGIDIKEAPIELSEGPVIVAADSGVISDKLLVLKMIKLAEDNNIPYQVEVGIGGTTDAARIQISNEGVSVITISVPARYIHAPVGVVDLGDMENASKLIGLFLMSL